MATEFKLPELGENIESGDLVRLMIKPGASIAEGEPVMELETDKAVVEVPSSVTGTVGEIRVKEGDKLKVGQVIFTVENGAAPSIQNSVPQRSAAPPQSSRRQAAARRISNAAPSPRLRLNAERRSPPATAHRQRIQAPRTRREHRLRRPGAPDDQARRDRFRRPAGHGTRNRQSRRRSPFLRQRSSQRNQSQRRTEGQSRRRHLHSRRRRSRSRRAPAQARAGRTPLRTAGRAPLIPVGHACRRQDRRTGSAARSAACRSA